MKNNLTSKKLSHDQQSHIIYKFTCNLGECESPQTKNEYIGLTTQTLRQRMIGHKNHGSIFAHFRMKHGISPDVNYLLANTEVLYRESDAFQLHIYEALHIRKLKPNLNENTNNFTCLKLSIY